MRITHCTDVAAPIDVVWRVYTDVERWPHWMESMDHVDLASSGAAIEGEQLRLGSQVWIRQPRRPAMTWEVTELAPGHRWTWVARSAGTRMTATHDLTAVDDTVTRVDTGLTFAGVTGSLLGRMFAGQTRRYMDMEAAGLRAACAAAR